MSQLPLGEFLSAGFTRFIQDTLAQCRYAKDLESLLDDASDFYVRWTAAEVRLENYYHLPRPNRRYTGVCYELTYQLGRALQERFEISCLFMAADGNCPRFYASTNTNHTFIIAIPWDRLDQAVQHFSEGHAGLPPGICLIDPSFNLWGVSGDASLSSAIQGYGIKKVYEFEAISPTGDRCEVMPFQRFEDGLITTHTLPLGLLSQLAPELKTAEAEKEEQLVVFGFQRGGGQDSSPVVFLGSRKEADVYPVIRRDWEEKLPPTHALNRFLRQIRAMIAPVG